MLRTMKVKRTVIDKVSAGSTVGKNRCKIVADSIGLADLGCHAFKDGTIPAGRSILRHNLSTRVKV